MSADNYNSDAAFQLGCLYHQGLYIEKDIEKAIRLYKNSSSFNNCYAKNNLGVIYKSNMQIKNISFSKEYFMESIKQKDFILSMFNLVNIYLDEGEIEKSINLLIKLSIKEFITSQLMLCYLLTKNQNDINLKTISGEIQKYDSKLTEFASKILDWYKNIQPYLLMGNLASYYRYFHSIDLLFISDKIISSDKLNEEMVNNTSLLKGQNINHHFYEGFNIE